MGNEFCKAGPNHQQQTLQSVALPPLSEQVQAYLQANRKLLSLYVEDPFEKQFEKGSHKHITKSYPDGVYSGPLNIMGNPSGYGRLFKNDGSLYIGQFSNGKAEGQGVLVFKTGAYAKGTFVDNMFAKGEYCSQGFKYEGEFKNNLFHGQGEQMNIKDGYQFTGTYNQGHKVQGTMKWRQDKIQYIYEGKFNQNGQFVNGGKLIEQTIGNYVGEYKNNKKHGKGVYEYENGVKYVGQYVDGTKQGPGILYNGDETISYDGLFKNGLPHGIGKAYNKQGKAVQADWIEGINKQMISS